jgi:cytochrome c oxidase subunit IV
VWGVLLLLTAVTVITAQIDLGSWNILLALLLASAKGTLVVLVFMHLREHAAINKAYVVLGFILVALLTGLTLADVATRLEHTNPSPVAFDELPSGAPHGSPLSPGRSGPVGEPLPER